MEEKNEIRPKIGIGYHIGHLTVESDTGERKSGYTVWKCRCDCGGTIHLDTRCLQRGKVRDCGCRTKVRPGQNDLTGRRFGRLVCLEPTDERGQGGTVIWRCRCDCGKECLAAAAQLTKGYKRSCGCLSHPPIKDFIGRRFGMLTVLSYEGKHEGMHRWRCRCDCGQETVVGQTLLQSGKTRSCGCLQKSTYIDNLKLIDGTSVTILESLKKRKSTSSSGITGVYRDKKSGKWIAQITFKGKKYHLGTFDKIEEAAEARKQGEEMHDEFLEWYHSTYDKKLTASG